MKKLLQSFVLLLVTLSMPLAASASVVQVVNSVSHDVLKPYPVAGGTTLGSLPFNPNVTSRGANIAPPPPMVFLDKHEAQLQLNHQLTLTVSFDYGNPATLKAMSSDNSIATVRVIDNTTIQVEGHKEGTATIIVSAIDGSAMSDECEVTVYTACGDVNCDGSMDIEDVTLMIDYVLGKQVDPFKIANADTDRNGSVDIGDVTMLIDWLLNGQAPFVPTTRVFNLLNKVSFKMVAVEGGTFTMGATDEQGSDAEMNESPAHQVTVSGFCIGETEVTQALWEVVMYSNPSYFRDPTDYYGNPQHPVENVSWDDCQEFIFRLNLMTGCKFRLPTEAEWEFAARGGCLSQGYKYSGSNTIDDVAWTWNSIPSQTSGTEGYGTQPVASKSPNELGLYDMSGNVWEWCQEWNCSYDLQNNPISEAALNSRMARGGSWNDQPNDCRLSRRGNFEQWKSFNNVGLRLVLDESEMPAFHLSESVVAVELGETKSVDIIDGSGNYTVSGGDVATIDVNGHCLTVNGNAVGESTYCVMDNATGKSAILRVVATDPGRTFTVNGVSFKMMDVEGGTFMMGNTDDNAGYYESPAHQVTVSDYSIGQTEVTQALWNAVMGYNKSYFSSVHGYADDPNRPVETVTWTECQEFIAILNEYTGEKFRLPTDAEWEFAARGGNLSSNYRYAGSNNLIEASWNHANSSNMTHPVATKAPNELGLYDMSGNVCEYCLDWLERYTSDAQVNPVGPFSGYSASIHGGCWSGLVDYRVSSRGSFGRISDACSSVGLRLVLDKENSPKFRLSETTLRLYLGESRPISILNGHGDYTVTVSYGEGVVDLNLNNDRFIVDTKEIGCTKIYVTDNVSGATTILNIVVTSLSEVFAANGVVFRMVKVIGDTFEMGATPEQAGEAEANEMPVHQVTLSSYYIGQTEVTQGLWNAVMGSNPSHFVPYNYWDNNFSAPVESVSWYDCQAFIAKLNEMTGRQFRLPTEAEWEFAARGGRVSQGYKYSGSNTIDSVAWYYENSGSVAQSTKPTATKDHNEMGLYDMSGNVWEWCQDWYGGYSSEPQTNPTGPLSGTSRVIRGGCHSNDAEYCRVSFRSRTKPTNAYNYLGLRLVLDSNAGSKFQLSETVANVSLGKSKSVNILNGRGAYTVVGGDDLVDINVNHNCLTLTGKAVGTTTIYVTDDATGRTAVMNVIVNDVLTFTVRNVTFKMVAVEGGSFTMGATAEQGSDALPNETPAHQVTLSSYAIGQTEVTQRLWMAVMGFNPSVFSYGNGYNDLIDCPVENVSWEDCQLFIAKLNEITGLEFRLPTEAEWEYAARGGNKSQGYMYSGSNSLFDVAWFFDNCNGYNENWQTYVVASKSPNELGLYDMSGNVSEWCQDWYGGYSSAPQTDPTGPVSGAERVCRGGYTQSYAACCRVSARDSKAPTFMHRSIGLRLVL